MFRHVLIFALGVATGAGLAVTFADVHFKPEARLRFDMNNDGGLSFVEIQSNVFAVHGLLDANNDGQVTWEEIDKVVDASGHTLGKSFNAGIWFKRFDSDGNQVISATEINHPIRISLWFKTIDRNADKKVTVEEIENLPIGELLIVR